MHLLQIATFVALVASVSAGMVPTRRDAQFGRSLLTRDTKPKEADKTPIIQTISQLKPAVAEALKRLPHPEQYESLKPQVREAFKSLQPELEKAIKDKRPADEVVKELKPKITEAFKGVKPGLDKLWDELKPGLAKALDTVDLGLGSVLISPFILIASLWAYQ
jgi:hypothetical protein